MPGEKSALTRNSLYYTIKPMPRIISSYIFKEMAVPFLMVIAVLAITSLLSKTLKLVELVINHGVGLAIVIKFIMFIMPSFLIYIIPMSFLIAVLITFNRLSTVNKIAAKDGIIMSDQKTMKITLRLFNGTTHRSGDKGLYTIVTFNTYDLNLSLKEDRVKNPDTSKTNRDLTIKQLKERIADVKTAGEDPAPHIIDLHKRFALPASVFIFGILGIPLGIQRVRTTKFTSFTVGLGIVLFYYILSTALESLGEKGMLDPVLAVWGSDIFMFLIGIHIFYKTTKDSPIKSLAWLEEKKEIITLALKNISLKRKK